MKITFIAFCTLCAFASAALADVPAEFDDYAKFADRHVRAAPWSRFPPPKDGKTETAMEHYVAHEKLRATPEKWMKVKRVWDGPTPWDTDQLKLALVLADTERGEVIVVIVKHEGAWEIQAYSRRWLREQAAEPGATDNPDDAQRLREDH